MPVQNTPIDLIAYNSDGTVVLLAETRNRRGTSETWAAKFRRNMLAHGILPYAKYFLIATPERIYGWNQENLFQNDALPQFTIDAQETLAPYFTKMHQDPTNISPKAFELLILTWLTDIASSTEYRNEFNPALKSLSESGLLPLLHQAQIEMNSAG